MFECGQMLVDGIGCNQDYVDAAFYYKHAADKGHKEAMYNYAQICFNGYGDFKIDKSDAAKYFKMAADNGNKKAMYNYALMCEIGEGVPKNKNEADKYYKMCGQSSSSKSACCLLI